ncbi:MAG TPA: DUF5690 family protein [Polyangiaceae bacterium]
MKALLQRAGGWRLNLAASLLAFSTYFCMYAFRKPFAAGSYDAPGGFGLDLKTLFVVSQVLGYTLSKYLGIKWVSEVTRARRVYLLIGLIAAAELALLGFALLPRGGKVVAIFMNGLPLGMIWGLVVRYLEGRRSSDVLLSALSCSFILASGVVKDVGRWLLTLGVAEYWMPALAGLLFLPALIVSAWLLDALPDPNAADAAAREARPPMGAAERAAFGRQFLFGLVLLLFVYLGLTAFRDFRDNFGVELFQELGYAAEPAIFSKTELPVALLVLVVLSSLVVFHQRVAGLIAVFAVMLGGLVLIGAATLGLDRGWVSGQVWMICGGLGAYLAYVPFSSFLFDRIMAATRFAGTAVFAVNVLDAAGYTGSVAMQLYKDLVAGASTRLAFFKTVSYTLSVGGTLLLAGAAVYFIARARASEARAWG